MTNRWIGNVAMLCPAVNREAASFVAASISGNINDGNPDFFSRPVIDIGGTDVLYYLAHSRIRESVLSQLPSLKVLFPGAEYYLTSFDDDPPNTTRMTVEEWLASLGLQFEPVEEEI